MKNWTLLLLICGAVRAAEPVEKLAISDNRFLFILNTSSAMKSYRAAAETCIVNLVRSGVDGRMQAGDTFGIWTYNKELHTGDFPMQVWTPELNTTFARQAQQFLTNRVYESGSHFDKVVRPLAMVAITSQSLLVFLITDGDEPVKGTPYDRVLNEALKTNYKTFKKKHLPFVIVFGVEDGQYTGIELNSVFNLKMPDVVHIPLKVVRAAALTATNNAALTNQPVSPPPAEEVPTRVVAKIEMIGPIASGSAEPQPEQPGASAPAPPPDPIPASLPIQPAETRANRAKAEIAPSPVSPSHPAGQSPGLLESQAPPENTSAGPERGEARQTAPEPPAPARAEPDKSTNESGSNQTLAPPLASTTAGLRPTDSTPGLLYAAGAFAAASVGLGWLLFRRAQGRAGPSLISRSMEKTNPKT